MDNAARGAAGITAAGRSARCPRSMWWRGLPVGTRRADAKVIRTTLRQRLYGIPLSDRFGPHTLPVGPGANRSDAVSSLPLSELLAQCHRECRPAGQSERWKSSLLTKHRRDIARNDCRAAPISRFMCTLQGQAATLISSVSAAVRSRDRNQVSRQCEPCEKKQAEF